MRRPPSPGDLRQEMVDDEPTNPFTKIFAHRLADLLGCFALGVAYFEEAQDAKGKQSCVEGFGKHAER